ncbi:hypothetical protein AJ79_02295 [Helicocarpus griseus UAMH5409]|uniref:Uncharacterized protein n=1 Tax=Helicocarpus griseus UAMH5409 TaxID=1447875 RepID=A0A2B7Y3S9_9EURO|nr:hypothetical protein AJ79_02295 [Helicocarpus griseus UAMH5409]
MSAFQSTPHPPPPTILHKSQRIPQSAASSFLTSYLTRASTSPGLQPDSTLSAHGPVSANTGGAINLIIHNLTRVQAGLDGQVLGRDLSLDDNAEGVFELQSGGMGDGEDWDGTRGKGRDRGNGGGWQDLQSWEREQEVVDAGEGDGEEAPEQVMGVEAGVEVDADVEEQGIDKEERKRRKKERRKEEKKAKSKGTTG